MNYKKTWLGYLNFILALVLIILCILGSIYGNLVYDMKDFISNPSSDIAKGSLGIPGWASFLIGAASVLIVGLFFYLIRKFRIYLYKAKGYFHTDLVSERLGGFSCFLIFAAGLFLRAKAIIDQDYFGVDVVKTVDTSKIESLFNTKIELNFSSFDALYDSFVTIVFKFTGIKESSFMWLNFGLHIVLILFVYCVVRNLFNGFVAIVPMLYICLYPENIKLVVTGGYENLPIITVLLVFLLATIILSFFSESDNFSFAALISTLIFDVLFLMLLPMLITKEVTKAPVFSLKLSSKLSNLLFFEDTDWLCLTLLVLILFAVLSFFYSTSDRITPIFPITVLVTVFFVLSDSKWSTYYLVNILTCIFAGLGLEELLTSKLYVVINSEPSAKTHTNNPSQENVVQKPVTEQVSVSAPIVTEGNENDSKNLESSDTAVIEDKNTLSDTPVQLFESPLPLPKKHVKKEIEFKLEPDGDRMSFDVDILDNDDFDV